MANQEHLDKLRKGALAWNSWRTKSIVIHPDLSGINLRAARLSEINFSGTDLSGADLRGVILGVANMSGADLSGADLSRAQLSYANLSNANLTNANLSEANLSETDFRYAQLKYTHFNGALIKGTHFGDRDFRSIKGLETIQHQGPSPLSINSLYLSEGAIPEVFVRGTGAPNTFIEYMHSLINQPIEYYTCFISYSSKDQDFTNRLYTDLQASGVRCWFAPEDLKIGDHYHQRIEESIRFYDKVILILSEYAVQSTWVEREVIAAREKEEYLGHETLFPINLDMAVMQTTKAWAADVRRRWHIGDFTQWKYHDAYQQAFERLLRDLTMGEKP